MYRSSENSLNQWRSRPSRKPLVIRGARQVGKTHLVRMFAKVAFSDLIEINFDKTPEKKALFRSGEVHKIVQLLSVDSGKKITPGETLIFLDEIQAAPEIFAKLRYFYEDLPELHIIAAGSLLEFMLAEHEFSMPVGRIEYMYLGPMNFREYLHARGESMLTEYLGKVEIQEDIPNSLHEKCMAYIREFFIVGGMPAAVRAYAENQDLDLVHREHQSVHQSYQDDFSKYGNKVNIPRLQKVYRALPLLIAKKMKYTALDPDERSKDLAQCLDHLEKARIMTKVVHSSCNGVPLSAERNDKVYKPIFLDIGLLSASLGLKLTELYLCQNLTLIHSGMLCEQFVGQHLMYAKADYCEPELHYWNREKKSSSAEVDFVISDGDRIVPVEVKAGKTGRLRSLTQMITEKDSPLAVRFNSEPPSLGPFGLETKSCRLISLPFYLVGELDRLFKTNLVSD